MKGRDYSMGIYTEKRDQLIEKIKGLEKRIASDTVKKKTLEDKLKEVSRLAMTGGVQLASPVSLMRSSPRSICFWRN